MDGQDKGQSLPVGFAKRLLERVGPLGQASGTPRGRELTHGRPLCWIRSASPEWGRHFAPSLARWKPRVYDDDEDDGPLVQYTFRMS